MNPFRGPTEYNVLRLDIDGRHEIISKYPIKEYLYRYIAYPFPIIIRDLKEVEEYLGLTDYELSIEGETIPNNPVCIFDVHMQDIIIDRAVELATVGYKENTLQSQIMTNIRKE